MRLLTRVGHRCTPTIIVTVAVALLAAGCVTTSGTTMAPESLSEVVTPGLPTTAFVGPSETASPPVPAAGPSTLTPTPEGPDTLVVWGRGGLPPSMAEAARVLPDVLAVGLRRGETVGMTRAVASTGEVVTSLTDGFRLPLQAVSLQAGSGMSDADVHERLSPGQVLIPATSAALRGLDVGATVDLVGRPSLLVAGIVPDDVTGTNEIVLHPADADLLGWDGEGTLIVEHMREDVATLEQQLLALVPDDVPAARVVTPDATGPRAASRVLPSVEVKRQFGEFAYRPRSGVREIDVAAGWVDANIVTADVAILGTVRCHREIVDDLTGVLDELVDRDLSDTIRPEQYAGCFYPRRTGTSVDAGLSRHSWGIALDINVDLSAPGGGVPPPDEVIEVFRRRGFRWGGDFLVPDNHHFEWVGLPD